MRLLSKPLTPRQLKNARTAAALRAQGQRLISRFANTLQGPAISLRMSTFPRQFEGLRDQLFERAKSTPVFLGSVFTMYAVPTDEEITQAIESRLFSVTQEYPLWFGQTPDADSKAHDLKRDHDITHGFIKAAPLTANQQAALTRRKRERHERERRITERLVARGEQ